jgi:hypothetical protein
LAIPESINSKICRDLQRLSELLQPSQERLAQSE